MFEASVSPALCLHPCLWWLSLDYINYHRCLPGRTMEAQDNSGWKGPPEESSSTLHWKQGQQWNWLRLPRAFPTWVLENSGNEDCTTSVWNLLQCWLIPRVKRIVSNMNLPCSRLHQPSVVLLSHIMMRTLAPSSWWSPHKHHKAST